MVEAGLHAFFSKNPKRITGHGVSLYPAVIPVGAQYWIGENGEIVSSKLTVYRNDEECLAAFNAKKYGKPIRRPKN
ncbi:hypothetical protein Xoosp13_64 [Xanthomonas phage Xoo-sp13]|nr:hypothetical protein Xoosp13_64 [Xanthomonas phage Xoo-sp13]